MLIVVEQRFVTTVGVPVVSKLEIALTLASRPYIFHRDLAFLVRKVGDIGDNGVGHCAERVGGVSDSINAITKIESVPGLPVDGHDHADRVGGDL